MFQNCCSVHLYRILQFNKNSNHFVVHFFNFINSGAVSQSFSAQYDYKGAREYVPYGYMLQETTKSIIVPKDSSNIVVRGNAHTAFSNNNEEVIRFQLRTKHSRGKQGMTLQTWGDLKNSFAWQTTFD